VREVAFRDEDRDGAVGYLRVRIVCTHDSVYVADHDRFNLQRAEFAMTAMGMVVSTGFDLDEGG